MTDQSPRILLTQMAIHLGSLRERVMFVGGTVTWIHITDAAAEPPRQTIDVDLVIEVASINEYHRFAAEIRSLGFCEDSSEGAPICRWTGHGLTIDLMPTDGTYFGFSNRWFRDSFARAWRHEIEGVGTIRIAQATDFIAMKVEAFRDRGAGDYLGSKDLEDVIAVLDGRAELADDFSRADASVRSYVANEFRSFLGDRAFINALPGHFAGDPIRQKRVVIVLERMQKIADSPQYTSDSLVS
jgi:predicted nucleotidyltransferase